MASGSHSGGGNRGSRPYLAFAVGAASLGALVVLWEVMGRREGSALSAVMPPPSVFLADVAETQFHIGLGSNAPTVYQCVLSTLLRVFAGMAVSLVAALVTGALLSLSRTARWILTPLVNLLAPIAPIAWIPIALVLFGITNEAAVFVVFMGVYFVLTLATLAEIRRVPPQYLTVAENLGTSAWQRWLFVVMPAVLPGVFTLLRVNFMAAWMSVLVAEMVGLRDGVGAVLMMGRNLFNSNLIMFGMLLIGACGFVIDKLLALVQHRLLWWRT
ncbi:MAG: binding-protein-dependent transport system inner rane component [Myxococcales bacterium]|nr:binding-protein-dependent transport system inner rane component [Myxococcales bacterium]